MQPEGTRGTLLTDWRPDRMHRPHSPWSGKPLLIHPSLHSAFTASLSSSSSTFNLAQLHLPLTSSPLPSLLLSKPTSALPPSPQRCLLLQLPLATRHSQMSAGSRITETARLSPVATWHLKAVHTWDTVSHSALIAVY